MLRDHGVDDLNLPRVIGLLARSIPESSYIELFGGGVDARVDGDEKEMRRRLGDDTDDLLLRCAASRQPRQ